MKTGKRILSIFLAVLMLLTPAPLAGFIGLEIVPKAKAYSVGDLIQFGTYPQTKVDETPELKAAADAATWKSYGYYSWSDSMTQSGDWMEYSDFFCNGEKYRAVIIHEYRPYNTERAASSVPSAVGYTYWQKQYESGYALSQTYYFKYEPLVWRVLDPDSGLILCETIIDSQPLQNLRFSGYEGQYLTYWADSEHTAYAFSWAVSSIRKWLDSDFFETAFTSSQKEAIQSTVLNNESSNPQLYPWANGVETIDRIFLLSHADVKNNAYGFENKTIDSNRRALGTDYAKSQGLSTLNDNGHPYTHFFWLLRSSGIVTSNAGIVDNNGSIEWYSGTNTTCNGIRPACRLSELKNDTEVSPCLYSAGETTDNMKHFPEGYDFEKDSYHFTNWGEKISKSYFTTLYENAPGESLYKKEKNVSEKGLCYGMAMTTAAIYNGYPNVNLFAYLDFLTPKTASKIRDLDVIHFADVWLHNLWLQDIDSIAIVNNKALKLGDYIKYAHIYQWSSSSQNAIRETLSNNIQDLFDLVKDHTDNNKIDILIGFIHYSKDDNGNWVTDENGNYISSRHRVLAVGYTDQDILIDDPNSTELQKITINEDGTWSYSKPWISDDINEQNTLFHYYTNITGLYNLISTGTTTTVSESLISDSNATDTEHYIDDMHRLDADNALVTFDSPNIVIDGEIVEPVFDGDFSSSLASDGLSNSIAYWVKDTGTLSVTNTEKNNNEICIAKDNILVTANLPEQSGVKLENADVEISTSAGEFISFSIENVQNYSNSSINIQGIAAESIITAEKTDAGIAVTGLNNMTITYSVNDEVVAETTVNVTDGREVTISVDDAENTIEAAHAHDYQSSITTAATCTAEGVETYACSICDNTYTKPIGKTAHTLTTINQKNANCTEKGYTGDQYCTVCKQTISTGSATNALGHTAPDGNGNCTRCGKHIKDVTPSQPQTNPNACKWCGKVHSGFFQSIVGFFHRILAAIFGAKY